MVDLEQPYAEIYPIKHPQYDNLEIKEDEKEVDEKNNTYITVHIQPKSSIQLSDANKSTQTSNEKVKDTKIKKENEPQTYFVKCNKTDQPSKKYCKECKNYRTKLKVTKLDEQIAENKKLNEKGEEITNYVSKFVALFGLDGKNDIGKQHFSNKICRKNQIKQYSSSQENITKNYDIDRKSISVSFLPKKILPKKLKPKSDENFVSNNFLSSVIFTEKDIVNYEDGENKKIESYSLHSIDKYKTKPAIPVPKKHYSKRVKESRDLVLSKSRSDYTKCKKYFANTDKHTDHMKEQRSKIDTEKKLVDAVLIQKTPNKLKQGDNELVVKKSGNNKGNTSHKKINRKESKLLKVDKVKKENLCVQRKQKSTLNVERSTHNVRTMSNLDNKIIRELKSEVKANRKHLINMERILIKRLSEHKPDKKDSSSQINIKAVESKNDVRVTKKYVPVVKNEEQHVGKSKPKNIQMTKKILDKNVYVQKYTYKPGKIKEMKHEVKDDMKLTKTNQEGLQTSKTKKVISNSNLCKNEETPLKKYTMYPTILWPHSSISENLELKFSQFLENIYNLDCKSSMQKINELIIPTSNILKFCKNSYNRNFPTNNSERKFGTDISYNLSVANLIGVKKSAPVLKQCSPGISRFDQRLRRSQSIPLYLVDPNQSISIPTYNKSINTSAFDKSNYVLQDEVSGNCNNEDKNVKETFKERNIKNWNNKFEIIQNNNNEILTGESQAASKKQITSNTNIHENESGILPLIPRRKMMRTRSEIHSIEEFYRRYRRTASLPPSNVSDSNVSAQYSTTNVILKSNANRPGSNGQKTERSKTPIRGDYVNRHNPNETNNKNKSTNNSKNSTNRTSRNPNNNNWNRHTIASTSCARSSFDISCDVEKQYMDSIKRHLEYLKEEQEKINMKQNNRTSDVDENITSRNIQNMFLRTPPKPECNEVYNPINTGKIRFSEIAENKKILSLKPKNMFNRITKLNNIILMNNAVKTNYEKLKSIDTKPKLEKLLQKSDKLSSWRITKNLKNIQDINKYKGQSIDTIPKLENLLQKSDKLSSWRITKNLKNIQEINKYKEPNNITVSCESLPTDIKVTVSFEKKPLKQELFTSDALVKSDLSGSSKLNVNVDKHAELPKTEKFSPSKTNILAQNLQCMLERNVIHKPILNDLNTEHINKLSKKLIDNLSALTSKSNEIKKQDLVELIKSYNEEVTVEFFNIISPSTHKLSSISTADNLTTDSRVDPSAPPQPSSEPVDNKHKKVKKRVVIRPSGSQSEFVLSKPTTSHAKKHSLPIDGNESMTEIELELLKTKQREALEKLRSEQEAKGIKKSVLSLAAVDSIILTMRRKSSEKGHKTTEKSKTGDKLSDGKTGKMVKVCPLESAVYLNNCQVQNPTNCINSIPVQCVPDIPTRKEQPSSFSQIVHFNPDESKTRKVPSENITDTLPFEGLPDLPVNDDVLYPSMNQIMDFNSNESKTRIPSNEFTKCNSKTDMRKSSFVESTSTKFYVDTSSSYTFEESASIETKPLKRGVTNTNLLMNIPSTQIKSSVQDEKIEEALYPLVESTTSSINVPTNKKTSLNEKSMYLKRSEVDLHKRFSEIIFLENYDPAKQTSTSIEVSKHEIIVDSNSSSNVPSITRVDSKLKKIDLVDNTSSYTETEKFNELLDSFTVLQKIIDRPTESELTNGLPPNVLRNNNILPSLKPSDHSNPEIISADSEITIEEISASQGENSKSLMRINMSETNEKLVEEPTQGENNRSKSLMRIKMPETNEQLVEAETPHKIMSKKFNSFNKEDCKCQEKCKILTEEILKKADCECIKHGNDSTFETCTCIQNTDKSQLIRVVCGQISYNDRCQCKTDDDNKSIETEMGLTTEMSSQSMRRLSTVWSAPIKIQEGSDLDLSPEELGTCFRRGFRADNIALSDAYCLLKRGDEKLLCIRSNLVIQAKQIGVNFSEQRTPLDFLIALGFSVDEASIALRNDVVKNRLSAAITEARIWCNNVSVPQGTLLYLLAYKAKASTMRYFLQMVEAIINSRIPDAVQLDAFIKLLDKLESGHLPMLLIFGKHKMDFDKDEGRNVQKQLQNLFVNMFSIAKKEAAIVNREFTAKDTKLLEHLTTYYRPGLYTHLETIAKYVGRGQLVSLVQMEAAIIYLSRLNAKDPDFDEFESYCGMKQANKLASDDDD